MQRSTGAPLLLAIALDVVLGLLGMHTFSADPVGHGPGLVTHAVEAVDSAHDSPVHAAAHGARIPRTGHLVRRTARAIALRHGHDMRAGPARGSAAGDPPLAHIMREWLTGWGQDSDMGGMDHGGGMMSPDDLAALEDADGVTASRLFLEQMIMHHEGAVQMARKELAAGKDGDALDLAQRVVDDQTAEITEMRKMLNTL